MCFILLKINHVQELLLRLEDSRGKERRLEDLKHNLEVCLADATQQIQELKVIFELCSHYKLFTVKTFRSWAATAFQLFSFQDLKIGQSISLNDIFCIFWEGSNAPQ